MFGMAGFIDVETTGFSPINDEVIEFAICLFKFNRETGEIVAVSDSYVGLREAKKRIPRQATQVHGLTNNDIKGKELDMVKIESMLHKAEFLVAHNASFDKKFTKILFPFTEEKVWLCSMRNIRWKQKGFSSMGLQNLLAAHGIKVRRSHRAEDDVMATLKLLSHTCSETGERYFLELLERLPSEFRERKEVG